MALNIKTEKFEGPFDLLLHLIKKNKMDIYDIKIYDITNQYMSYLDVMKEFNLEIASEFILIASTMLEIKSKMLLPEIKSESEKEEEEDPREALVTKLLEYKKYKVGANYLRILEQQSEGSYSKKAEIIEDIEENKVDILDGISIIELYDIFYRLLDIYNNKTNKDTVIQKKIPIDIYTIKDKMKEISTIACGNKRIYFNNILTKCNCKIEIVVTFLALLELVKLRLINVEQENNFNEIYVEGIQIYDSKSN